MRGLYSDLQAISELPRSVLEELAKDQESLKEILQHHVVRQHTASLAELQVGNIFIFLKYFHL